MDSKLFRVRAKGPMACFTRPELKGERVSYEVMTPSAARGALESIIWKPAIRWQVHAIAVLAPIRWTSFRRNEVTDRASSRVTEFFVEERRAQRNTVALANVDYVITASFGMTEKAHPKDNIQKFSEMFERRLEKGQAFHQAYLGCREFAADLSLVTGDAPTSETVDRPLGLMFYDFIYSDTGGPARPLFFDARLRGGVLNVPPRADVIRANSRQNGGPR